MLLVWLHRRRGTPRFRHLDEVPMVRGGDGEAMGGSGAGLRVLTPLSLSSLEQGDREVLHHPPRTQVTPRCAPTGLPTLMNKEAAALALVSRLPCALHPARGKTPVPGDTPAAFGVPHTWLEALGCPRAGWVQGAVVRGAVGATQPPPRQGGMGGSARPGTHIAFLLLHCTRRRPRRAARTAAHREDRAPVRGCGRGRGAGGSMDPGGGGQHPPGSG